jgi:SAM-dependent methyltransferase
MGETSYLFDTAARDERTRLEAQTNLWDPFTFRRLDRIGVGDGWRCLEIGGGTGSVATWLVDRVGTAGHVVATDLETRWLEPMAGPNCEVRRHDVTADPVEESSYDLVHARLVLMHLPARDAVVAKLAAALRPGGWLVLEDYDLLTIDASHPPHAEWGTVSRASRGLLDAVGADTAYGRKLVDVLRARGLVDINAEGILHLQRAPDAAEWLAPLLEQLRDPMIASGAATAADLDEVHRELDDGQSPLSVFTPLLVSACGRRPADR